MSVVLQFGEKTNNILVHLWNSLFQQAVFFESQSQFSSFDSERLFRYSSTGILQPRTVSFEERLNSNIFDASEDIPAASVEGWRKKSVCKFNPKSNHYVVPFDQKICSADMKKSINFFKYGEEVATAESEEVLESIRYQIEDCDSFKGVVSMADTSGFWGGYSSSILEAVHDAFNPSCFDLFGIYSEDSIEDQSLNLAKYTSAEHFSRFMPLYVSGTLNEKHACELMETYLTSDLFLNNQRIYPKGLSSLSLGTCASGIVPLSNIKNMCITSSNYGSIDFCVGRADNVDCTLYPEYYNLSIYSPNIEEDTLHTVSSFLTFDNSSYFGLRNHVQHKLITPIVNEYSRRHLFIDAELDWNEIREQLEKIATFD